MYQKNAIYYILMLLPRYMRCVYCQQTLERIDPFMAICERCWDKKKDGVIE